MRKSGWMGWGGGFKKIYKMLQFFYEVPGIQKQNQYIQRLLPHPLHRRFSEAMIT